MSVLFPLLFSVVSSLGLDSVLLLQDEDGLTALHLAVQRELTTATLILVAMDTDQTLMTNAGECFCAAVASLTPKQCVSPQRLPEEALRLVGRSHREEDGEARQGDASRPA